MTTKQEEKNTDTEADIPAENQLVLKELLRAGSHFGHKKGKWNPRMAPYVFGVRNGIYIIDLEQTAKKLEEAINFLGGLLKAEKVVVFVSTKVQARDLIKEAAESIGMPYVVERWIGGTLTNFGIINKRVRQLKDLEEKKKSGELGKYTKYEQQVFAKQIEDMNRKFGGLKNLAKLPDAVFLLELDKNEAPVREARQLGIPIVAVTDTNTDPTLVSYPIPANDDSMPALTLIMGKIKDALLKEKASAAKAAVVKNGENKNEQPGTDRNN